MNGTVDSTDCGDVRGVMVREGGLSMAGGFAGSGLQFLFSIIAARLLTPSGFGIFIMGLSVVKLAEVIVLLGLPNGLLHFVPRFLTCGQPGRAKGMLITAVMVSLCASGAVLAVFMCLGPVLYEGWLKEPGLRRIVPILLVSLPLGAVTDICLHYAQAFKKMRHKVMTYNILIPSIRLAGLGACLLVRDRMMVVVCAYVVAVGVALVYALWVVRSRLACDAVVVLDRRLSRQLLLFSLPLFAGTVLMVILQWVNPLIVGFFQPAEEVGLFGAAQRWSMLGILVLNSFSGIFAPVIAEFHHAGRWEELHGMFRTVTSWILLLSMPFYMLLGLLPEQFMALFGREFSGGWLCLLILAAGQLVNCAVGPAGYMLTMRGHVRLAFFNTLTAFVINIGLNFLLIPGYGAVGAAVAMSGAVILVNIMRGLEVWRLYSVHPFSSRYVKAMGAGLAGAAIVALLRSTVPGGPVPRLLIQIMFYLAVYATILVTSGVGRREWQGLKDILGIPARRIGNGG
ncbi:flippase [bacterium]|nr:flippase [candidate division CSSED10-310 bacterium]